MRERKIILSIETAVQGGSMSLLDGDSEIDGWIGTREISKSEDILEEIKNILERNSLEKKQIRKIVVSRGPGSYTGARLGIAVGYGLKKALDCKLVGVSTLKVLLLANKSKSIDTVEEITTAVPIGRNQICRQNFKLHNQKIIDSDTEPQLSTVEDFLKSDSNSELQFKKKMILHRKLYLEFQTNCKNRLAENNILIDAGENIAALAGMTGAVKNGQNGILRPIYAKENIFPRSS